MHVLKTVAFAAVAGALLGPFAVFALNHQNETHASPPPAWFRDTIGVVCSSCGPDLTAGHGYVVAGWRHPGTGDELAVSYGQDGTVDRYDLRGSRHARAQAVALTPAGEPVALVWDGTHLKLVERSSSGWQAARTVAGLGRRPDQLALAFADKQPVEAWLTAGRLTVIDRGRSVAFDVHGPVSAFELQGGKTLTLVWRDRSGAAVWQNGHTKRLGPASAPPQISGQFVVWRDGADIHLDTADSTSETIASGADSPVAVAAAGQEALIADQEGSALLVRTVAGRHLAVRRFPLAPHTRVTRVQIVAQPDGAAAVVWEENGAMVKALARPAGKRWSLRPSELTRRDETATDLQTAVDGQGRVYVSWDNLGFLGETVELAQIDLAG